MNAKKLAKARYDAWRSAIMATEPVANIPTWYCLKKSARDMHVNIMKAAIEKCEGK